jgi:hypothetical protein
MAKPEPVHEAFEECLELVFQGESVEDCLRRFPAQAAGLRPLLETVVATRKAVVVDPRPEFREQARQRLLAAQRDRTVKTKGRRTGLAWNWRPAWALSMAAFRLVVAGGGTVAASGGSMPGQPLYAVKHAAESARLALTLAATAKVDLYARLADQRVGEIVYLAARSQTGQIPRVTRDLDRYLARIAELSGGVSQDAVLLSKNSGVAAPSAERTGMASTVPPVASAPAPETGFGQAEGSFGTTAAADQSGGVASPRTLLITRISAESVQNVARLKAALADAAPAAESALVEAIAVSQSGYEKVLQALQDRP